MNRIRLYTTCDLVKVIRIMKSNLLDKHKMIIRKRGLTHEGVEEKNVKF